MSSRYISEFSRKGNFTWYYSFAYDEYELQHSGIGTLMTVGSEYLADYREDGWTVEQTLWHFTMELLLDYFSRTDGAGQRCMLRKAFEL